VIKQGLGSAILDRTEIEVKPQASYAVEIKLLRPVRLEKKTGHVEVGTLSQSFDRVHAGCFEFLETAEGFYRLRGKRDQIRRTRNVAFIVKDGRRVVPGAGMTLVEERETSEGWDGRRIHLFRVDPGAAGEVVRIADGAILSAWHENYRTSVRREDIIGHTRAGLDLFGVALDEDGDNVSFPEVHIKGADGQADYNDVYVNCWCDGKKVDVKCEELYRDDTACQSPLGIAIRPGRTRSFPTFVAECVIEARQKSTGQRLCCYRFAIIPLIRFGICDISTSDLAATYCVKPCKRVRISHGGETVVVNGGYDYFFTEQLSSSTTDMRMSLFDSSSAIDFTLGLAGVEIRVSDSLRKLAQVRPLNASDAREYSFDDEIIVRTYGNRSGRIVTLRLGDTFLLSGEQPGIGEHVFGLFDDPSVFAPRGERNEVASLSLRVDFGMRQASKDHVTLGDHNVTLLRLDRSLGIGKVALEKTEDGVAMVRFESPATAPMKVEFHIDMAKDEGYRTGRTKRRVGSCSIESGTQEIVARRSVELSVRKGDKVTIRMVPINEFGDPDIDFAIELPVCKE
jgi:hypothetical protein